MKNRNNKKLIICLIINLIILLLSFFLINSLIKKNKIIHQTQSEFYTKNKEKMNRIINKIDEGKDYKNIKVYGIKSIYVDRTGDTYYVDFSLPTQLFDLFSTYRGVVYSDNNTPYILEVKVEQLTQINSNLWKYSNNDNEGYVRRICNKWFVYSIDL